MAPAAIARLTCPIGVAGIAGKAPEVIAAAVVAQLLRVAEARVGAHRSPTAGDSTRGCPRVDTGT